MIISIDKSLTDMERIIWIDPFKCEIREQKDFQWFDADPNNRGKNVMLTVKNILILEIWVLELKWKLCINYTDNNSSFGTIVFKPSKNHNNSWMDQRMDNPTASCEPQVMMS